MTFRTGATFSDDMKYRYRLWRHWDNNLKAALFIMLNPSTANEFDNDPTVTRCIQRAKNMGFGGIEVCNVFAYRATDPDELYKQDDPIGIDNASEIYAAAMLCGAAICGWGTHAAKINPDLPKTVRQMLGPTHNEDGLVNVMALGFNKDGSPKHPLYMPYDTDGIPTWVPFPLYDD